MPRPKGMKDGETKNKILAYVHENPGCIIKDLATHTQRTDVNTMAVVQQLELTDKLKVVLGPYGKKYLFDKDYEGEMLDKVPAKSKKNRAIRILEIIEEHPGLTQEEISLKFSTKQCCQYLHYVLKTLEELNYIDVRHEANNNKKHTYYIMDKEE